jgi:nucleotide-binding universal stress UspA family protein
MTIVTFADEVSRDEIMPDIVEKMETDESQIEFIETLPPDLHSPQELDSEEIQERIKVVDETLSTEIGVQADGDLFSSIQEEIDKGKAHQLEQVIDFVRSLGIQVSSNVLHGTPFIAIIREVLQNGHDLVMITAEDVKGLKNVLFGTTSMHLMRKCPCPVWVFNPNKPKELKTILAAVNLTPFDDARNTLDHKIMELATSLAHREGCELLVIHTWTFALESHVQSGRVSISRERLDEWIDNTRTIHKRALKRMLEEFLNKYEMEDLKHQVYLLKGIPGKLIPALAAAKDVDLIIMGTVSRSGVSGLLIGNTAERILNQVNCSVMTVKPDGFITPIQLDADADNATRN